MRDHRVVLPHGPSIRIRVGGEGPGLLLLHGFASGLEGWPPDGLDRLARTRRVVAVDLPGHGRSGAAGPGDATPARLVSTVEAIRDSHLPGPDFTLLGYSMGARLALTALAAGLPIRRLLLESPNPGLDEPEARAARSTRDEAWARRFEEEPIEQVLRDWLEQPIFASRAALPPEVRDHQRRVREAADGASLSRYLREFGTGTMPSTWTTLGATDVPVRVAVGEADTRYVEFARRMRRVTSDIRVTTIAGAGHAPHLETPARWTEWIERAMPTE